MARSKGFVVVLKDKNGALSTVNCATLVEVESALERNGVEPADVFVFTSAPIEIKRALTIATAPRKPRAKSTPTTKPANGKPDAKTAAATAPAA
jgi:hypothetical protein